VFEVLRIMHRHVRADYAQHGCVERVKALVLDQVHELRAHALRPTLALHLDELHPPVLGSALSGGVPRDRFGVAEALGCLARRLKSVLSEPSYHGVRALLRELLVEGLRVDIIRVSLHAQLPVLILLVQRQNVAQHFFRFRLQGGFPGVEIDSVHRHVPRFAGFGLQSLGCCS
jgi:hypothetical protein